MQWHKMSKKSLTGRIIVLPVFIIILVVESILNKVDDWSYSVKRLRIRMNEWIDKKISTWIKQSPLNAGLLFTYSPFPSSPYWSLIISTGIDILPISP